MIIDRKVRFGRLIQLTWKYFVSMTAFSSAVVLLEVLGWHHMHIPWAVPTIVGTAVAFYIGFKNNSSYDRQWEARKIWGAIVNASRSWGIMVKDYVSDVFVEENSVENSSGDNAIHELQRELIYRHIAWLYCLRRQLWKLKPWEHDRAIDRGFRDSLMNSFAALPVEEEMEEFLPKEEIELVLKANNPAAQLIARQSEQLKLLRKARLIDDFRHMAMGKLLVELYSQQGKCERIKNYPFPRQYANSSIVFVFIFLFLLPLGLMSQFNELGNHFIWLTVPFSVLVGWVYWLMEMVGDYAENPFAGLALDTPMTSLCRSIEIDLREMLGETDLPPNIEHLNGIIL